MQQQNNLQHQLQRAYAYIQAGQRNAAYDILVPICRAYPHDADAWWLMAHAVDNPLYRAQSLERVLAINPFYPGAQRKLEQVRARLAQPAPQQTYIPPGLQTTPEYQKQLNRSAGAGYVLLIVAVFLCAGSILLALYAAVVLNEEAPVLSQAIANAVGTSAADRNGLGPGGISGVFSGNVATPDPSQFGDTYWQGSGDGYTMEYLAIDGRYRRFYEFPIQLYVDGANTPGWQNAVNYAVFDINQHVQIQTTQNRNDADIILEIRDSSVVQRECEVGAFTRVVGCASIDYEGGILRPIIKGHAMVATDTNNPQGTILHELLHAMGVVVHSADQRDIMYYEETPLQVTRMTARDINTLRRLYASPSYND